MFIISRFASLSRVGARSGDSTSFQYDSLNRTTSTTTSSGDSYNYEYAGDGQLYKMEDTAAGVTYRYNYDSIGRLIGTNQTGGAADLRAAYGYDNESRLKSINYSIPGVVDSATETFYYNTSATDTLPHLRRGRHPKHGQGSEPGLCLESGLSGVFCREGHAQSLHSADSP